MIISFFELLATYVVIGLWAPNRLENKDLSRLAIPIATDNIGGDFILGKMYAPERPTSWMLQELAAHNLTTNIAIISKRQKGNSGEWSILADKLSRNVSTHSNGTVRRVPEWECPN